MKNRALSTLLAVSAGLLLAATALAADPNPFFERSPLQYQAPPFDKIRDADYAPAIEEGMKRQIAEIEAIANDPAPPTFANTIEAMERSGELLTRVAKVFFNLAQSNTNDAHPEDPRGGGPEARRAPGRDLPEPEALRAREGALRRSATRSGSIAGERGTSSSATTGTSCAPARELLATPTRRRCAR